MKLLKSMALTVVFLLWVTSAFSALAQSDENVDVFAVQFDGNQMNLYSVDPFGNFVTLQSFTGIYVRDAWFSGGEWEVARVSDIVMSPDHQQLSFTAIHNVAGETMLFLYQIENAEFQRIPIPGLGQVIWSPDSKAILLAPPDTFLGGSTHVMEDAYLYSPESSSLSLLVSGQNIPPSNFMWLPDGETIVYVGASSACDVQPCVPIRDLHTVDRLGQVNNRLTDLRTLRTIESAFDLTAFSFCDIQGTAWSTFNHRLFYSLDCVDSGGFVFSTLMSVSLSGENQLEGRLVDSFPAAIRVSIINIHPDPASTEVYVIAAVSSEEVVDGFTTIKGSWNVLNNATPGSLNLLASHVFDHTSEAPVNASALSQDTNYLILAGGELDGLTMSTTGYLAIIDLLTEDVTEYFTDEAVCNVEWVDSQTVRYRQFDSPCSNEFRIPAGTWQLDIQGDTQTEITANLNGFVWVLEMPASAVELTPTPTAVLNNSAIESNRC